MITKCVTSFSFCSNTFDLAILTTIKICIDIDLCCLYICIYVFRKVIPDDKLKLYCIWGEQSFLLNIP